MRPRNSELSCALVALRLRRRPGRVCSTRDAVQFPARAGLPHRARGARAGRGARSRWTSTKRGRWFVVEMPGYPLDTRPTGRSGCSKTPTGTAGTTQQRVRRRPRAADRRDAVEARGDRHVDPRRLYSRTPTATARPKRTRGAPRVCAHQPAARRQHSGLRARQLDLAGSWRLAGAIIYTGSVRGPGRPLTLRPGRTRASTGAERPRAIDTGGSGRSPGDSQYGEAFDPWGHYFASKNSNHVRHRDRRRPYSAQPRLAVCRAACRTSRITASAARVFPITSSPTFELLTESGEFTSACSLTPCTGEYSPASPA